VDPHAGNVGIANGKLIVPGDPDSSILYSRLTRTDSYKMPPLGHSIVDANGAALIREWIETLPTSCVQ
jgi:hypothetical protein